MPKKSAKKKAAKSPVPNNAEPAPAPVGWIAAIQAYLAALPHHLDSQRFPRSAEGAASLEALLSGVRDAGRAELDARALAGEDLGPVARVLEAIGARPFTMAEARGFRVPHVFVREDEPISVEAIRAMRGACDAAGGATAEDGRGRSRSELEEEAARLRLDLERMQSPPGKWNELRGMGLARLVLFHANRVVGRQALLSALVEQSGAPSVEAAKKEIGRLEGKHPAFRQLLKLTENGRARDSLSKKGRIARK